MESGSAPASRPALRRLVSWTCVLAFVAAALGFLGWPLGQVWLTSVLPGAPPMNPLTAVSVMLAAVALGSSRESTHARATRWLTYACGAAVTAIAALRLLTLASGVELAIDLDLFRDQVLASSPPSRMGFYSALSLMLFGLGLLLLDVPRSFARRASERLLLAATGTALMAIVGYLYSASAMHGAMAISTAFAMLLLGCGSLLARPDRGLVNLWFRPTVGGALARRLLPIAIAVPLVFGWFRLAGQRLGWYGLELGTAILALAIIAVLVGTVATTARALDGSEVERLLAEEALRKSLERQSLLLESNLIGVLTVVDDMIVHANPAFLEMVGYAEEELPVSADSLTPPEWRGLSEAARREIAASNVATPFEKEYLHKHGRRVPVLVGGAAIAGTQEIMAFVVDLSGKKLAELEMDRMRLFLDSVVENIPNMVFVKEAKDLKFVRLNRAGEDLLGISREEILGKCDADLFPRDEAEFFIEKDRAVLSSRQQLDIPEEPLKTSGGAIRYLHTKKVPIMDADGTPQFLLGISEDITERKRAERRVESLNEGLRHRTIELEAANQELEAFSYSVSHDLRAPLRHLDGFADLLARHSASQLDEKGRRYLGILSSSAKHMGRLIDDLLSFSRMSRTEMQQSCVSLDTLVAGVRRSLESEASGRKIDWKIDPLPTVHGDPAMLRLVFINLLANAIKYTGPRSPAVIEVSAEETNDEWVLFVKDNGVGFDMHYEHKLFGVFQRLHGESEFEGTGIGLANVRRIIRRHGGRTWAKGAIDRGATFYVSLPRHETLFEAKEAA